ncbi:MAG: MBL fold metallo-hydrolase [Acidimicrobiales bacterium]
MRRRSASPSWAGSGRSVATAPGSRPKGASSYSTAARCSRATTFPASMPSCPDLEWLIDNADRVDAIIATHAHEDHIGALPYLFAHLTAPIYGSRFTLGMIEHKLREARLFDKADLRRSTTAIVCPSVRSTASSSR